MSYFWTAWKTALRARRKGWLLVLLIPALAFAARQLLPAEDAAAPVRVGVVLPERGGEAFWKKLEERSGLVISFRLAGEEEARRQVAAGEWDCALLLPPDFEQRLERLDTYQLMDLLTGPGSAVYPMVREIAAACVAELACGGIAEDYLLDSGIADGDSIGQMRPRLEQTLPEQDRVLVSMETVDGRPLAPFALADSGTDGLLSGLLAIVLLVYALFAAMDLGSWLDSPFARRLLPLRGALELQLPRLAARLLPAWCAAALALPALGGLGRCLLPLCAYVLFLGMAALALARCRPLWTALPVLMPFVPVAALLLSPVLLDLSLLLPALAPVARWSPVTLYLRACGGSRRDTLALAAGAAAILALLWTLERVRDRKHRPER